MKTEKSKSIVLGILQSIVAISAIPAGLSMVMKPDGSLLGMPLELLKNSPFTTFLIPGLLLLTINGLAQGFAAISSFKRFRFYKILSIILGIALVLWIVIQVYFINPIHFLQVIYFLIGIAEVLLSFILLTK